MPPTVFGVELTPQKGEFTSSGSSKHEGIKTLAKFLLLSIKSYEDLLYPLT